MKQETLEILEECMRRYAALECCRESIVQAYEILQDCAKNGGTVFTCGNGGSAADAEHIVGELMKRFRKRRPISAELAAKLQASGEYGARLAETLEGAIPAVALTSHLSLSTAFANDKNPTAVFAQQLFGLGKQGGVLLALSTSGNSENCVYAVTLAKAMGIRIVSLTGGEGERAFGVVGRDRSRA